MVRHTIKWATILCSLYTITVYGLVYFAFASSWVAGFMMMSLPVVYLINLAFFIYWLLKKSRTVLLPTAILILGLVFQPRTYSFNGDKKETVTENKGKALKIVSFNAHGFYVGPGKTSGDRANLRSGLVEIKDWLLSQNADIFCLPEYFSNKYSKPYDMNRFFAGSGYPYRVLLSKGGRVNADAYLGMAIFSRYPIVSSHDVSFKDTNGLISADIKVGSDTIRVISVHLHSMTLRVNRIFEQRSMPGVEYQVGTAFQRMKIGFIKRASETVTLKGLFENSPYPVVVCGDFNETPYSFTYGQLRKELSNAFEEKGEGFGFTYKGMPSFIRIDNQFFDDKRLKVLEFKTLKGEKYSDHYGLSGTYLIKKKAD